MYKDKLEISIQITPKYHMYDIYPGIYWEYGEKQQADKTPQKIPSKQILKSEKYFYICALSYWPSLIKQISGIGYAAKVYGSLWLPQPSLLICLLAKAGNLKQGMLA